MQHWQHKLTKHHQLGGCRVLFRGDCCQRMPASKAWGLSAAVTVHGKRPGSWRSCYAAGLGLMLLHAGPWMLCHLSTFLTDWRSLIGQRRHSARPRPVIEQAHTDGSGPSACSSAACVLGALYLKHMGTSTLYSQIRTHRIAVRVLLSLVNLTLRLFSISASSSIKSTSDWLESEAHRQQTRGHTLLPRRGSKSSPVPPSAPSGQGPDVVPRS